MPWSRQRRGFGQQKGSGFFGIDALFDGHVFELTGVKNVAALETLDEFCVLFAGYNAHTRMPTVLFHILLSGD